MKILSVIPARGGSKGLHGKNIRELGGKPLIAWTIDAALKANKIDKVICSTDDEYIASVAKSFGCAVPFLRPSNLAEDHIQLAPVVLHAISWLEDRGDRFDVVTTLQCTSPFRDSQDIERAIKIFLENDAESLMSICETSYPPYWSCTIDDSGRAIPLFRGELSGKRRQDLPVTYERNGAIFINKVDSFKRTKDFLKPEPFVYVMERERSIDIDVRSDFDFAEFLLRSKSK